MLPYRSWSRWTTRCGFTSRFRAGQRATAFGYVPDRAGEVLLGVELAELGLWG